MHYCVISKFRHMALPSIILPDTASTRQGDVYSQQNSAKHLTSSYSESDGLCVITSTCVGRHLKETRNGLVLSHYKLH